MLDIDTEKNLFQKGYKIIGGMDEAGRGPLAGPVVVGLVAIEENFNFESNLEELRAIKDSKQLTSKKREELAELIQEKFTTAIGVCDNQTIDRINIRQAVFLAMKKALGQIKTKPQFLLLDGRDIIPNCSYRQKSIKQGDKLIFIIAAGSIIAKVARDKMMEKLDKDFPNYGFAKHKGYGTKEHLEQIKKHGPCQVHRLSFKPCRP